MPRHLVISGREALRALEHGGFVIDHQDGSHISVHNPQTGRHATVAVHGNQDLPPGTLRSIIRQAGLTVDEFQGLLK